MRTTASDAGKEIRRETVAPRKPKRVPEPKVEPRREVTRPKRERVPAS